MIHQFDAEKVTQLAGVLLRFEEGKMEYLRLLKLLYIADREGIQETGRPLTCTASVAMDHGPLSSEVYDLIKGEITAEAHWSQFIRTQGHNVELESDPGRGRLSRYEIAKLNDVSQRHAPLSTWALVDLTHDFQEWKANKPPRGSSRPIPLGDILDAAGRSDEKAAILAELEEKAAYDRFFQGART